jgi:hypothetical protein
MKRRPFLGLSFILAIPASFTGLAQATVSDFENELYTALLNRATQDINQGEIPPIVVAGTTAPLKESIPYDAFMASGKSFAESIAELIPEATRQVVDDLVRVGEHVGVVRLKMNALRPGLKVHVAPETKLRQIFEDHGGNQWKQFKATYGGASAVNRFSRVGWDSKIGQALVLWSMSCGALCGSGHLVLLKRQWGIWSIIKERRVWIS